MVAEHFSTWTRHVSMSQLYDEGRLCFLESDLEAQRSEFLYHKTNMRGIWKCLISPGREFNHDNLAFAFLFVKVPCSSNCRLGWNVCPR